MVNAVVRVTVIAAALQQPQESHHSPQIKKHAQPCRETLPNFCAPRGLCDKGNGKGNHVHELVLCHKEVVKVRHARASRLFVLVGEDLLTTLPAGHTLCKEKTLSDSVTA